MEITNSDDLAFGYANRSLVCLVLRNYILCLENIWQKMWLFGTIDG